MFTIYVSVYIKQIPFTAQICREKCLLYTVKDGVFTNMQ